MKYKCPICSKKTIPVVKKLGSSMVHPIVCSSCNTEVFLDSKYVIGLLAMIVLLFVLVYRMSNPSFSILWIIPVLIVSYPLLLLVPLKPKNK